MTEDDVTPLATEVDDLLEACFEHLSGSADLQEFLTLLAENEPLDLPSMVARHGRAPTLTAAIADHLVASGLAEPRPELGPAVFHVTARGRTIYERVHTRGGGRISRGLVYDLLRTLPREALEGGRAFLTALGRAARTELTGD